MSHVKRIKKDSSKVGFVRLENGSAAVFCLGIIKKQIGNCNNSFKHINSLDSKSVSRDTMGGSFSIKEPDN